MTGRSVIPSTPSIIHRVKKYVFSFFDKLCVSEGPLMMVIWQSIPNYRCCIIHEFDITNLEINGYIKKEYVQMSSSINLTHPSRSKSSLDMVLTSARLISCFNKSLIFIWISPFHLDHCQVLAPPIISWSPVSSNSLWRSGLEMYFAAFTRNIISTFFFSQSRTIPDNLWPSLQTLCPYMEPVSAGRGWQLSNFSLESEPSGYFMAFHCNTCV